MGLKKNLQAAIKLLTIFNFYALSPLVISDFYAKNRYTKLVHSAHFLHKKMYFTSAQTIIFAVEAFKNMYREMKITKYQNSILFKLTF